MENRTKQKQTKMLHLFDTMCMYVYACNKFIWVCVSVFLLQIATVSSLVFLKEKNLTLRKTDFDSFKQSVINILTSKPLKLRFSRNVADLQDTCVFGILNTRCHIYPTVRNVSTWLRWNSYTLACNDELSS